MSTKTKFRPGVLHGQEVTDLLNYANENDFALPAVNVVGTNSVNAVLETAKKVNSPVMIQFSNGGAVFFAGKSLSNENQNAAIVGGISGAMHVHTMAAAYGIPVILHTDHCAKKLLPWIDGLLDAGEKFYEELMSDEETRRTWELPEMFAVLPAFRSVYQEIEYDYPQVLRRQVTEPYVSSTGDMMTFPEIEDLLELCGILEPAGAEADIRPFTRRAA